jgi:Na+/H+ antiporter NhaD/arsenite permease-like protein
VSALIPIIIVSRKLKGDIAPAAAVEEDNSGTSQLIAVLSKNEKLAILILGVFCLLFVPVFKMVTHLPPFVGILLGVGVLWVYTDIMYGRVKISEDIKLRLAKVISRIDGSTLMFFLGILFAVDALKCAGVLSDMSAWLDRNIGNVYLVNLVIGVVSSIVDNVPLVAGAMGMYPIATDTMIASAADPTYLANFVQDGVFWQFLAYCAGVGGSMLIIGSAAGVVVMGLEKINFIWYLKHFSWLALIGYLAGAGVYILERMIF